MSDDVAQRPVTSIQEPAIANEALALQRIIAELSSLSLAAQKRLIDTVCTFLGITAARDEPAVPTATQRTGGSAPFLFSEEEPSAKQFLLDKAPTTDVERVACLAYYLAHYRSTPHFKTKDITALNTEAAQRQFSNAAYAVENATKAGYVVPSVKGCKQLSAAGEKFVAALPDRESAREALDRMRPHRQNRAKRSSNGD